MAAGDAESGGLSRAEVTSGDLVEGVDVCEFNY